MPLDELVVRHDVVERHERCLHDRYAAPVSEPTDLLGRPLHDLRISITDRCNFRCVYCMPKEVFGRDHQFLPRSELLTFEEITRLARAFVANGVRKIRITGGEPLVRRDVERLIAMLSEIRIAPAPAKPAPPLLAGSVEPTPADLDLTLTTNGALLPDKAQALADAGLKRVTVSLDSLDDLTFRAMNDTDFPVQRVLDGIEAAAAVGLPVKVNAVVKRGLNDDGILDLARHFRATPHVLRFIEYMDVGHTNGWRLDDVVPAAEIVATITSEFPLEPVDPSYRGEVARRWRYVDGSGEIGVIASVTQPFCGDCTRARISADGQLYTCLFAVRGTDLRGVVRDGATDAALEEAIAAVWRRRTDRYSEIRSAGTAGLQKIEMSYIGG
jgi:cyclic pyranopterin phosphate synthase